MIKLASPLKVEISDIVIEKHYTKYIGLLNGFGLIKWRFELYVLTNGEEWFQPPFPNTQLEEKAKEIIIKTAQKRGLTGI